MSISVSDTAINEGESVKVTATAADSDGTIQSVEFRRNGNTVKTDTSFPYEYTYNSASAGTHRFEATAVDDDGDETISTPKTVEVNAKPTVSLTVSPAEITLGQEVTLTATAADSDGTVVRVSFIRGKVFAHDTDAPFKHNYTPAETGEFTFYAQALDNDGAFTNSDDVTFTVIAAPPPPVPPTVSISVSDTAINEGESVTVTATAADSDGSVQSVEFRRNGTMEETDTSSPYEYTYSSASAGTHRFQAIATDNDGLTTTSNTEPVEVNAKPTVSLTVAPAEITLGQMVTLTATATDSDGTVVRVSFIRGKVFAHDTDAPFKHNYTPAETGEFTFYAQALDNDGAFTNSDDVTFTVIAAPPPPVPPTVSISVSDTAINEGESVTVTATAADSDGSVQSVEFRRNGTMEETDTSSPYEYTYSSASAGTHRFQAIATDNDGLTTTSNTEPVEVNAKPTVSLTVAPAEITLGQMVTLTATATDSDGTITRVSFIRGKVFVHDTDAPYTHTYTPAETGEFTFYAQALDNDGAFTNSNDVTFTVIAAPPPPPPPPTNEAPEATLSFSDSNPNRGDTIMITGNYTDDSNLASATIYDLGTGDNTGNTGTFSSIDDPDESISGVEGSIVRDFTFLANTPLGAYTFRTKVVDADSASDTAWGTVTVTNIDPTVSFTVSPAEITLGQEVTLTATAADSDGSITRVSFIRGKVFVHDTDAPYTHTYTPAETGEFTFYAQALDNDGAFTNSNNVTFTVIAATPVVVQESETWPDIDNDGYLDQVLAKLEKPALLGISGSIMLNGVELRIDEVSVDYYDPVTISNKILTVALTTVGFRIEMDHTYRVQFQDILESVVPMPPQDPPEWVDWSPILPEPGGPLDGYVWCDYENQWIIWAAIPETFRVVKYGKASMVIGAAFSEDVNGDGVDETVHNVTATPKSVAGNLINAVISLPTSIINHQYILQKCVDGNKWIYIDGPIIGDGGLISVTTEITADVFANAKFRLVEFSEAALIVDVVSVDASDPQNTKVNYRISPPNATIDIATFVVGQSSPQTQSNLSGDFFLTFNQNSLTEPIGTPKTETIISLVVTVGGNSFDPIEIIATRENNGAGTASELVNPFFPIEGVGASRFYLHESISEFYQEISYTVPYSGKTIWTTYSSSSLDPGPDPIVTWGEEHQYTSPDGNTLWIGMTPPEGPILLPTPTTQYREVNDEHWFTPISLTGLCKVSSLIWDTGSGVVVAFPIINASVDTTLK